MLVQPRDRKLLSELDELGLATSEQLRVIGRFGSMRRINDRLLRLLRAGLLRRCFIGTIAGGKRSVYTLSPQGAGLIGTVPKPVSFSRDELVTADQFIRHQLSINDVYLGCRYGSLPEGVSFVQWKRFGRPLSDELRLIPDGYCELATPARVRCLFLEVDLGNEASRIWKQKAELYLQLALSGRFTDLFHQPQFGVLVIANSDRRLTGIRKVIAALTDKLFWFTSLPTLHSSTLFGSIWVRPDGQLKQQLF